jgi:hypothetical protein
VEFHAHVPKFGKTATHWLLEGFFIVTSVFLGFGVAQSREARADRELAARALGSLTAEVEHNLATLEPQVEFHRRWLEGLSHALATDTRGTARDAFIATWPNLDRKNPKPPFSFLRRGAWDAALSTGALRLFDYDIAAGLSEIYQWQEGLDTASRQMPYSTYTFFDPAARRPALTQTAFAMEAVLYTEIELVARYRTQLPGLRSAASEE